MEGGWPAKAGCLFPPVGLDIGCELAWDASVDSWSSLLGMVRKVLGGLTWDKPVPVSGGFSGFANCACIGAVSMQEQREGSRRGEGWNECLLCCWFNLRKVSGSDGLVGCDLNAHVCCGKWRTQTLMQYLFSGPMHFLDGSAG